MRGILRELPRGTATCALCLRSAELRESHIIPEFFYKPVYDAKHRFVVFSTDPAERHDLEQKGLKQHLLCDDCEERFCRYETYVSKVFYAKGRQREEIHGRRVAAQVVDYALFRCFILSLIWRMSESKLSLFRQLDLGPRHSEIIRQALLRDDPLRATQYPFIITEIMLEGQLWEDFMMGPQKVKAEGQTTYRFIISGRLFIVGVSGLDPSPTMYPMLLHPGGKLFTLIQKREEIPFLNETLAQAGESLRQRKRAE